MSVYRESISPPMSLHRTFAIALKELRHITRDARTLFLVTASPAFMLFTFAYVFSFDVNHADLALLDLDKSPAAREYVASLTAGDSLSVIADAGDYADVDRLLVDGTVDAALVIPPGFGAALHGQRPAQVQAIIDGSDTIAAGQAIAILSAASQSVAIELQPLPRQLSPAVEIRSRAWYNPTLESLVSMVPGLLGVVLSLPALALSLGLTREKELGTLEGLFATPIRGIEYLVGKVGAYVLTGAGSALLAWLVAVAWFQVPFRGDLLLLLLLTVDYLLASMGLSLIISYWVASQQTATFIVLMAIFVPSFFLAGLIDPIDRESPQSLLTAWALPTTHFITISRALFLKGVGLASLVAPSLALLGMGLAALLMGLALFKKKIA
jgi:ABC-2 type transport system permease protein